MNNVPNNITTFIFPIGIFIINEIFSETKCRPAKKQNSFEQIRIFE